MGAPTWPPYPQRSERPGGAVTLLCIASALRLGGGRAHDVRGVVEHHLPAVGLALEDVRRDDRRDRHAASHLGEDVLGAGDPGETARDGELHVADGEADLARVVEDGLPGRAHVLPSGQQRPARVDALDVLAVRPDLLHLGEIEGLERAVEARIGLFDLEAPAHHGSGQETTTSSPSRWTARGVSASPAHGPATQRPVSGSNSAPWVEQTKRRPSSLQNSLGQRSSGVPTCGQLLTYAWYAPSWLTTRPSSERPPQVRRNLAVVRGPR